MKIHRSSMEKILDQQENDTVITDPKHPLKTWFRKIRFRYAVWKERLKHRSAS